MVKARIEEIQEARRMTANDNISSRAGFEFNQRKSKAGRQEMARSAAAGVKPLSRAQSKLFKALQFRAMTGFDRFLVASDVQ
jgi:hypothetical protein